MTASSFLDRVPVVALALDILMSLPGCPSVNTYTVPRSVPRKGMVYTIAAPELVGVTNKSGATDGTVIWAPTFVARIGVSDSVDIGMRAGNMSSIGGDAKILLHKGPVDVAINPALHAYGVTESQKQGTGKERSATYLHAPFLVGFNVDDTVTFVLTPGLSYAYAVGDRGPFTAVDKAFIRTGVAARLGLGIDIHGSERFAVHPEITAMRWLTPDSEIMLLGGLGFNWGRLPVFATP